MFEDKNAMSFKAQIKRGTKFFQDHSFGLTWPDGAAWRAHLKPDVDTIFDATIAKGSTSVWLVARGFGLLGTNDPDAYGNGSLAVTTSQLDGLIISNRDRQRIIEQERASALKKRNAAQDALDECNAALLGIK